MLLLFKILLKGTLPFKIWLWALLFVLLVAKAQFASCCIEWFLIVNYYYQPPTQLAAKRRHPFPGKLELCCKRRCSRSSFLFIFLLFFPDCLLARYCGKRATTIREIAVVSANNVRLQRASELQRHMPFAFFLSFFVLVLEQPHDAHHLQDNRSKRGSPNWECGRRPWLLKVHRWVYYCTRIGAVVNIRLQAKLCHPRLLATDMPTTVAPVQQWTISDLHSNCLGPV